MNLSLRFLLSVSCLLSASLFTGCQSSSTGKAEISGFLGDYSDLKDGADHQATLVYINDFAKFSNYTKVLLDPVVAYQSTNSDLGELDAEQLRTLTNMLFTSVHEELSKEYELVEVPGPDTMRVRIAITEAVGARVALNTASSIIPIGLVGSSAKKMATGSHAFVGKAAIEVELLDSVSGMRLAAAVDERASGKNPLDGKWDGVDKVFDFWATKLSSRLHDFKRAEGMQDSLQKL